MNNFSLLITDWYRQNKRDLPWRNTINPYFIWLSEIILQQTRVEQGMQYYLKFVQNYPTVIDLANAEEKDILNDWQGLGYYSRARNLHFSAKLIRDEFNGTFPDTYKEIKSLKGVGNYTAAAISSFAFGEKQAVVDGNVYRLLSRVFDIDTPIDTTSGQKEFQSLADELISDNNPGEHNQAIMEIGAIVCTPKQPKCVECPLNGLCLSYAKNTIDQRPVKSKKTKVTNRYFHYLIYNIQNETYIEQREGKGIWQNMFQFPLIETDQKATKDQCEAWKEQYKESKEIIHILSHQRIHAVFHHMDKPPANPNPKWLNINTSNIQDYPLPRIIDRYLDDYGF